MRRIATTGSPGAAVGAVLAAGLCLSVFVGTPQAAYANRPSCGGWQIQQTFDGDLDSISASAPDDVWAVGRAGNKATTEHFDGNTWSTVKAPGAKHGPDLESVSVSPSGAAWAVGVTFDRHERGKILTEHLVRKRTWEAFDSGLGDNQGKIPDNELTAVTVVSPTLAWAVGFSDYGWVVAPIAARWDGTGWHSVTMGPEGDNDRFLDTSAASESDAWSLGLVDDQDVVTHYDGSTWTETPLPPETTNLLAVAGSDAEAWAVGGASTARSVILRWDGTGWDRIPLRASFQGSLVAVSTPAPGLALAAGFVLPPGGGAPTPIIDAWDGTSWSPEQVPGLAIGWALSVTELASGEAWAVVREPDGRSAIAHRCPQS